MFGRLTAVVVALTVTLCALGGCGAMEEEAPETADSGAAEAQAESAVNPQLDGVVADGQSLSDDAKAEFSEGGALEPKVVYQYPELESGCEVAALASALQALGFDVTTTEIADDFLVVDGDYAHGYLASPHTDFGGGFPPGLVDAANAYLAAQDSILEAHDLTGSGFGGIAALANAGHPVCVWTTLENNAPNYDPALGGIDDWYVNEHCITVYSMEDGTVWAADPLKGLVEIDAATLATAYVQCGSMALGIW